MERTASLIEFVPCASHGIVSVTTVTRHRQFAGIKLWNGVSATYRRQCTRCNGANEWESWQWLEGARHGGTNVLDRFGLRESMSRRLHNLWGLRIGQSTSRGKTSGRRRTIVEVQERGSSGVEQEAERMSARKITHRTVQDLQARVAPRVGSALIVW